MDEEAKTCLLGVIALASGHAAVTLHTLPNLTLTAETSIYLLAKYSLEATAFTRRTLKTIIPSCSTPSKALGRWQLGVGRVLDAIDEWLRASCMHVTSRDPDVQEGGSLRGLLTNLVSTPRSSLHPDKFDQITAEGQRWPVTVLTSVIQAHESHKTACNLHAAHAP